MTPADEIRATLDVLHEKGWHKGNLKNPRTGELCWFGARQYVVEDMNTILTFSLKAPANRAIVHSAVRLFPDRTFAIETFNDHPDTTFEDIELVAKHAINDLELGEV